ncbi:hypothetical protein GCM10023237_57090 [Streptomyces coeruleoprunus]
MAAACTSSAGPIRRAGRPADIADTAFSSLLFALRIAILADPATLDQSCWFAFIWR